MAKQITARDLEVIDVIAQADETLQYGVKGDSTSKLFGFVSYDDFGKFYQINFMCFGSYREYCANEKEILSNCQFKTLRGVQKKFERMGMKVYFKFQVA